MSSTTTPRPTPTRSVPEPGLGTGRATALLVAAVALSVAASLLFVGGRSPAPAAGVDASGGVEQPTPVSGGSPTTADQIGLPGGAVAEPIGERAAQTVTIDLTTTELEGQLADGTTYTYWTFDGTVPGPMLRVREGDRVELTLRNDDGSATPHSIDLHAVNGPGGGAVATQTMPGEERTVIFEALNPGVYVYHCATPHIPTHIANGMYGLIIVEPEGGLPDVDRELYVMQGEIYTDAVRGAQGKLAFDGDSLAAEEPDYVVFNGAVGSLMGERAMHAEVGDTVRIFVGNGGPNLTSSFHVIGEIFDRSSVEGGTLVNTNVQTTLVPAGGATWVEFEIDAPGDYLLVDHAISRAVDGGAIATIHAEGPDNPRVFEAPDGVDTAGH
jgi:nitrite reductase (NO-forming)